MRKYRKNPICLTCNKVLKNHYAKRCKSCDGKIRVFSAEHKNNIKLSKTGTLNPNYKHGKSNNQYCTDCGNKVFGYNAIRCRKCYGILFGKNQCGSNNPLWNNGSSFAPYSADFTDELKEQIRKRDNYKCQLCNLFNEEHLIIYDVSLPIHHIDYDKQNCNEINLISLCK